MTATFSRTTRFLDADEKNRWRTAWAPIALLAVWTGWLFLAQVAVYKVTDKARLEVVHQAHVIASSLDGRVIETRLSIGRYVASGEPLIVLDSEAERLAIYEKRVRKEALEARIQAIKAQIDAEGAAVLVQQNARQAAVGESQALIDEAQFRAQLAEQLSATTEKLRDRNAVTTEEYLTKKTDVQAKQASVKALQSAMEKMKQDREVTESDRKVRLAKLQHETVELEGDVSGEEAAIRKLEYEIQRRTVRASISGTIGEVAELQIGSVVKAADKLGSVVPSGETHAVAMFPVAVAGHLQSGQPGRLRLAGFPWTQYGVIPATVNHVGNEPTNGMIRVELAIAPNLNSAVRLEHGLPCSAEVEIEQVSPIILILRAAGQLLSRKS